MVFAKDKGAQRQLVIDGQQRLVTLVLLLSVARNHFKQMGNDKLALFYERRFAVERLDENGNTLPTYVLELQGKDNDVLRSLLESSAVPSESKVSAFTTVQKI